MYLGQEWLEEEELVPLTYNGNGNANGVPWWKTAWGGVKEVLKVGTETFAKVAPILFDTQPTIPITSPVTQIIPATTETPQTEVTYQPYRPEQPVPTGWNVISLPTGQKVLRQVKKAGVIPDWGLPVALGIGGVLLMNMMGKKKRR